MTNSHYLLMQAKKYVTNCKFLVWECRIQILTWKLLLLLFSIHFHKSFHFISFWKEIQNFPREIFKPGHKFHVFTFLDAQASLVITITIITIILITNIQSFHEARLRMWWYMVLVTPWVSIITNGHFPQNMMMVAMILSLNGKWLKTKKASYFEKFDNYVSNSWKFLLYC